MELEDSRMPSMQADMSKILTSQTGKDQQKDDQEQKSGIMKSIASFFLTDSEIDN